MWCLLLLTLYKFYIEVYIGIRNAKHGYSVSPTFVECNITEVPTTVCKIGNIVVVKVCGVMNQSIGAWGTLDLSTTMPRANDRYNSLLISQDTTDPRILLSVTGTNLFIESKGASVSGWTFGQLVYACE